MTADKFFNFTSMVQTREKSIALKLYSFAYGYFPRSAAAIDGDRG